MSILFTTVLVVMLIALAAIIGKHKYKGGTSGDMYPWVSKVSGRALLAIGIALLFFGTFLTYRYGALLWETNWASFPPPWEGIGVLAGILIAIYGAGCFGALLLRNDRDNTPS